MMRSPEQQFAFAKKLPIPELAKVLQGQSDVVDMSIAEMVLRQKVQAQKAQQGMAAQQMAQSPKVVEKDLAEAQQASMPRQAMLPQQIPQTRMDQGVAGLPADVEVPEYAGGGIVAFQGGGSATIPSSWGDWTRPLGKTFADVFPTASKVPGLAARMAAALNPMLMFEAFTGPSGDDITRLKEFDRAKETLKQAGFTDKDIDALATPDVYRMATGYGYKPTTPTPPQAATAPAAPSAQTPANAAPIAPPVAKSQVPTPEDAGLGGIAKQIQALRGRLEKPTMDRTSAEVEDMYKAAGVSMDPYAEYKKSLAEEKEKNAADRTQAGWGRLLEAGLGIMGGESPYALTNIGKGAQSAAKGAMEDIKEFSKLERERNKALAAVAVAENDLKRGVTDKKIARFDKAMEDFNSKDLELTKLSVTADLKQMEIAASKGDRRMANALEAAQRSWKGLSDMQKMSGGPGGKPLDEEEFIRNRAVQYLGFMQSGSFGQAPTPAIPSGVKVTREK